MRINIGTHQAQYFMFREGLDFSMEGIRKYGNVPGFQKIRNEMGGFLFDLQRSRNSGSVEKQVHFLFLALLHLDNLEQEMRMSSENEEIIRLELIFDKIRSLKAMIAGYIRHLEEE